MSEPWPEYYGTQFVPPQPTHTTDQENIAYASPYPGIPAAHGDVGLAVNRDLAENSNLVDRVTIPSAPPVDPFTESHPDLGYTVARPQHEPHAVRPVAGNRWDGRTVQLSGHAVRLLPDRLGRRSFSVFTDAGNTTSITVGSSRQSVDGGAQTSIKLAPSSAEFRVESSGEVWAYGTGLIMVSEVYDA